MKLTIRSAKIGDLPQILTLLKVCIRHMDEKGIQQWPDWYPNEDIIRSDITKNELFVAEDKGQICGMVALSPEIPKEYSSIKWKINAQKVNSIHRLALHPARKKSGTAQKLMAYAEQIAKENNYDCIRLDTYSLNTVANRFYSKIAYIYCGDIHLPFMPEIYRCYEKSLLD